jgi:hypothetical protein
MDVGDRGQAHTLEAVSAAVVLLASVVFALQVTAVTPLTASTASQHIENQMQGTAHGVLDQAVEDGSLERTVLYWNNSSGDFHDSTTGNIYTNAGPPTTFGERLNETFLDRGIAFDLTVIYETSTGTDEKTIIRLGRASDNAVTAHRTLTLFDDDHIYDADESRNASVTLASTNESPYHSGADVDRWDQSPNSPVYNVVKVRLTVWQM